MTYEEAKAKAKEAGIPDEDLTPEVIKQFGHTFDDPTAHVNPGDPKLSAEQVKEHLSMLAEEAKQNANGAQMLKLIGKVAGALLMVLVLVSVSGCGTQSEAATRATIAEEESNQATFEQMSELCMAQAEAAYEKDIVTADANFDAAVKSVTRTMAVKEQRPITVRTVAQDGTTSEKTEFQEVSVQKPVINPDTYNALYRKKLEDHAAIERNLQAIRDKIAKIARNRANARALNQGLRDYFAQKANALEIANSATDQLLLSLEKFLPKPKDAPAATQLGQSP
ncbi:MAG: hypothetical protein KIS92_02690 [Planctomycetota bacterium]|nr:hypothetical protein [Planctomycetota bacterium]